MEKNYLMVNTQGCLIHGVNARDSYAGPCACRVFRGDGTENAQCIASRRDGETDAEWVARSRAVWTEWEKE